MFAKLFETTMGQALAQTFDGPDAGDYTFDIHLTYNAPSPFKGSVAVVTKRHKYPGTDEGEVARDAEFEAFDQKAAEALATSPVCTTYTAPP